MALSTEAPQDGADGCGCTSSSGSPLALVALAVTPDQVSHGKDGASPSKCPALHEMP